MLTGALLHSLQRDPAIDRVTVATEVEINVNGQHVRAVAVTAKRGPALISVVDGRLPRADQDIMLGATTLRSLGAQAGDTVRVTAADPVTGAARTTPFLVTGRASLSPGFGTGGLGTGAALTVNGLLHAQCPDGGSACLRKAQRGLIYSVLVHAVPGPAGAAALARYTTKYGADVTDQASPIELINFGESVNFPLLFGVALSLFGAATLVHLLLVSVSRRRAEAGLLKVLGFVRRQVAAVVTWQATAVILVGHGGGSAAGHRRGQGGVAAVRHQCGRGPRGGGAGRPAGPAGHRRPGRHQPARDPARPAGRPVSPRRPAPRGIAAGRNAERPPR